MTDQTTIARGQLWRHKQRGKVYWIVHTKGRVQCSSNADIEAWFENQPTVSYENVLDPDDFWTRPLLEFTDGRFEPVIGTKWCQKHTNDVVIINRTEECIDYESAKSGKKRWLGFVEFFNRYERVKE